MNCWYLTNDLMFSSRVVAQGERLGHPVIVVASPALLEERLAQASGEQNLVLVDLSLPGLDIAQVVSSTREKAPTATIIAYAPHVHEDRLAAAQAAGCDQVLTRGAFDRQIGQILAAPR